MNTFVDEFAPEKFAQVCSYNMDTWIKTHEEEAATDKITDNPNPRQ